MMSDGVVENGLDMSKIAPRGSTKSIAPIDNRLGKPANSNSALPPTNVVRKRRFGAQLNEIPDTVESMGLRPIFDDVSPVPRRIFWFLIVAFGVGFAGYQIVTQILLYLTFPVNISVNVSYVSSLQFPRVIVCNVNLIRFSQIPPNVSREDTTDYSDLFEPAIDAGYYDGHDWKDVFQALGHQKEDMILQCIWEGVPCTAANFSIVYTDMGVCAEFNADRKETQHIGEDYSLHLILHTELAEYINSTTTIGFKILISDKTDPALVKTSGIYVPTGYLTAVSIARQKITNLSPPWENCGELELPNGTAYSKTLCELECIANYLISRCNCTPIHIDRHGVPTCDPSQQEDCIDPAYLDYVRLQPACSYGNCVQGCEEINYKSVVSQIRLSPWHLGSLMDLVSYPVDRAVWDDSIAEVRIFYSALMEETVTHEPGYPLLTLLCDVGGALGLIIGASIVSVLEVFDFFIMGALR